MPPSGAALWRTLRAHQVYGANTDVGKTIVSTALCNAVNKSRDRAAFLKPVSTGPLDEADDRSVLFLSVFFFFLSLGFKLTRLIPADTSNASRLEF